MIYAHKLLKKKHQSFLTQQRQDPITGDAIQENDTVVICAVCKSAFLVDSWKYINEEHCGQSLTLSTIPIEKPILFRKENTTVEPIQTRDTKKTNIDKDNKGCLVLVVVLLIVIPFGIFMLVEKRTIGDMLIGILFLAMVAIAALSKSFSDN